MEAASFWPLELPAVTVASGSCLARTGLSLASESTHASARGCSSVSITCSPCRLDTVTPMISSAKMPLCCADNRPVVRGNGEFVLLLPGDAVLAAQVLGGLQHAAGHRVELAAGGGAPARQAVVHLHAVTARAPAHVGGVEGDVAHALRTAGDHEIVGTRGDLEAGLDDGLQSRTAAPVDLHARHASPAAPRRGRRLARSPAPRCWGSSARG